MAVTEADHVSFPVHQSQVYTHVSKLMDFPSSYEMALSHMEGSAKLIISVMGVAYLIIVIFFTLTQFLENKIYTQKTRKLRQNTQ